METISWACSIWPQETLRIQQLFFSMAFPDYEQNLELAQALRRAGWNVLAMHYRGSWSLGGGFSFHHTMEDADTEVSFFLDPSNVVKHRFDVNRVVAIEHSVGGFMAASATAHNPRVTQFSYQIGISEAPNLHVP